VSDERGFTLIELLVVVLIIAILAAIAIPLFIKQREKGYVADAQTSLRNPATAAEAYATANSGDYSGINGDTGIILGSEGYRASSAVSIVVASTNSTYCVTATHSLLAAGYPWKVSTHDSDDGKATDANTC
jgi:type IV pilus assembly protein PilA